MKTFQKPLSVEEEVYYIRLMNQGTGDEAADAGAILIERNLRLVAHIARKYQNAEDDMEDLISIGTDREGNEINLLDVIEYDQPDALSGLELSGNIQKLRTLFDRLLTYREKEILMIRYGLSIEEKTQREIGKKLGISRSYVSRIEKRALQKLREGFEKENK